jgi:Xaa-Pro aminopeptidase
MENLGITAVFLPLDASLEYFTGVPRAGVTNTCTRQNSAEYACLVITEKEAVYCNSRLSAMEIMARAETYPRLSRIIPFPDADLSGETFIDVCRKLGLSGKKLGCLQDISSALVLRLQKDMEVSWVNFDQIVQQMRAKKDPEEQLLMKKAAAINDRIYDAVFPMLLPGTAIEEITREIDRLVRVFGAQTTSFNTTVTNFGPMEGVGYGDYYPVLRRGYTLSYDYGVVYQGYCSDFGRTIFFGEPAPELIKAHELVMSAQKHAIAEMKAGKITGAELNYLARQVILAGGYDSEFLHRLGHGIGKDVHERPFLAEGEERVLEAGMCFTVEPSICLPLRGLVRVEDVVMVTPEGGENFNSTTWDLQVIE